MPITRMIFFKNKDFPFCLCFLRIKLWIFFFK